MYGTPIPLDQTLDLLGVEMVQDQGSKVMYRCPFCGHRSFRVNPEKAVWYCDPCQMGGGAVKVAAMVWDEKPEDAARRLREALGLPDDENPEAQDLIQYLDQIEGTPEAAPGASRSELRHTVQMWWLGAEVVLRPLRILTGSRLDPDEWFAPIEAWIDEGPLDLWSLQEACKLAARMIEGILARFGHEIKITPADVPTDAWLDSAREVDRTLKHAMERARVVAPNASVEQLCEFFDRIKAKAWSAQWKKTATRTSWGPGKESSSPKRQS